MLHNSAVAMSEQEATDIRKAVLAPVNFAFYAGGSVMM
jgi:hypothetical protein